jgi:hypothetical protein
MNRAPERPGSGARGAERGCRQSPIRPSAPQIVTSELADSPVGVARTAPVAHRARALLPGGQVRAEDLDHGDRAVAELLVEPAYDCRREQPQLGGPRGRVGADHEPSVSERLRRGMAGDLVAHQLRPPREHAGHAQVDVPAVVVDETTDRRVEELGIAVVGEGPGSPGGAGTTARAARSTEPGPLGRARTCGGPTQVLGQVQPVGEVVGLVGLVGLVGQDRNSYVKAKS